MYIYFFNTIREIYSIIQLTYKSVVTKFLIRLKL